MAIEVEIYAPERTSDSFTAEDVVLPGQAGVFTIQTGHTPLLSTLIPGVLIVKSTDEEERFFSVASGFAEVRNDRVVVLAKAFERSESIDTSRAEAARQRAEERLETRDPETDVQRAQLALARANARMKAANRQGY
ncbi:MAG: ATP synthase F1 subunit epsilon [Candidatus Hydrogenedentota bacterium]